MRHYSIIMIFLMASISLAGCTEPGGDSETVIIDPAGGCTVLFQIAETATHSPGNTSWTNHTYDSNCGKINTTITGLF